MHKDVQYETTIPKIIRLFNSQFLNNASLAVENKGTFFVEKANPPDLPAGNAQIFDSSHAFISARPSSLIGNSRSPSMVLFS